MSGFWKRASVHDGWTAHTLYELCEVIKGMSPTQKTAPGPYSLIVTAAELPTSDAFQIDGEAVCVPLVSSTGHGHASIKRLHYASGRFAVANIMAALVVKDGSVCDTKFLWLLLQHKKDELIVPKMKGTANVSLSLAALGSVVVDLPPLTEQRRIVNLISAVDKAIEMADRHATATEDLRAAIRRVFFATTAATVPLESIASTRLGKMLSASSAREGNEFPYLRNANVKWGHIDVSDLKSMRFSAEERSKFELRAGDVMICEGGAGVGNTAVLEADLPGVYYQKALHRVRCGETLLPDFFALWMEHQLENGYITLTSGATAIPHLTGEKLRKMPVPVFSATEQARIVETTSMLRDVSAKSRDLARTQAALQTELLTALLSGEREIPASYDRPLDASTYSANDIGSTSGEAAA